MNTPASFIQSEYKVLLDFLSMNCIARDMTIIVRHTTHTAPHTTLEKHTQTDRTKNSRLKIQAGFYINLQQSFCGGVWFGFHQNPNIDVNDASFVNHKYPNISNYFLELKPHNHSLGNVKRSVHHSLITSTNIVV